MSIPNWGLLAKSQVDPETIEEAIVRLISAHNDDETAHLGVGQALQSHKVSEIIDHAALSIIEDKLANREVSIDKLKQDKFILHPTFDSLDAWVQTNEGSGGVIYIHPGAVDLICGDASGDVTQIAWFNSNMHLDNSKNPFFQCVLEFSYDQARSDNIVAVGAQTPSDLWDDSFGFRWDATASKMYAFSVKNNVETKTEIVDYVSSVANVLRANLVYDELKIYFYVNDVLVATHSDVGLGSETSYIFVFGIKDIADSSDTDVTIRDFYYSQDW